MTRFPMPISRTLRCAVFLTATALTAVVAAGCGSAGNTDSARLRSVDAATNAGTSNLLVNGSASYGDQNYFNTSSYFYISTGNSTFTGISDTQATGIAARSNTYTLDTGKFYTAYYVGRADVAGITDNRFIEILLANDDKPTLAAGQAAIRLIDAAPDAGGLDVLVNGSVPAASFGNVAFRKATDNTFVEAYIPVPAGTLSVQVNTTGTSNVVVPASNISVQAGRAYTILVTEPNGGTAPIGVVGGTQPTYALQTTSE